MNCRNYPFRHKRHCIVSISRYSAHSHGNGNAGRLVDGSSMRNAWTIDYIDDQSAPISKTASRGPRWLWLPGTYSTQGNAVKCIQLSTSTCGYIYKLPTSVSCRATILYGYLAGLWYTCDRTGTVVLYIYFQCLVRSPQRA